MGLSRSALLWCSQNEWMKSNIPNYKFVKRASKRFMPGEKVEDALKASNSFNELGIEVEFSGENEEEIGIVKKCNDPQFQLEEGAVVVRVDEVYYRPTEVEYLIGDFSKSKQKLNWRPKHDINSIVKDMVRSDLQLFKEELYLKNMKHKL